MEAIGCIAVHRLKDLCRRLVDDYNPLGTTALVNEFKFALIRVELTRMAEKRAAKQQALERERKKSRLLRLRASQAMAFLQGGGGG